MKMPTPAQRIWLQYLATGDRTCLLLSQNRISKATKRACRHEGWTMPGSAQGDRITTSGLETLREYRRRANAR